ncbi:transmembrane protein 222-like [Leptinotarsa decemlineata]|uniref:transmembrane protein 222 n=1 Tax=Leptinotarsa decemlineata TaxID=7539 RepID=UPI000C252DF8|nr:transmembrane protein 222 [Leptinotarsa decemlineata]XP_023025597.1 transmembrane protein 222 [Leptinotarsa decemlineata]XP_023025598.1 transmembrane protein 222 [Leptinotarsa decemlineata]XP_023025599.1 transmembrane protein 222 [Leptinotarsa decemlineata]
MKKFMESSEMNDYSIDELRDKYPFCIVWTPIPLLTWIFPVIGHMGIALSSGIIRDFAGPYYVSEDNMAFGRPTKYWQLEPTLARGSISGWDAAVTEASEIYKGRMHNLICDNCHSHVATALNLMKYNGSSNWNMVKLAFSMIVYGKFVSFLAFVKTWLPFTILMLLILLCICFL